MQLHFAVDGAYYHTKARITVVKPQSGAAFEFLADNDKPKGDFTRLLEKLEAKLDAKPGTKQKRQH